MKAIFTLCIFCALCLCGAAKAERVNQKKTAKAKSGVTEIGAPNQKPIPDYSIRINGLENTVTVATDSVNVKTSETISNKTKVGNTIEINGQKNTVAISQVNKNNMVAVSQNGNNNAVKIVQSSSQP